MPRSENSWYTNTAAVLALVATIMLLAGIGIGGAFDHSSAPSPTRSGAPAYVYLTVTTSAATDYDTFYPANVTVPHGVPVYFTITCYDPGVNNVSQDFTQVVGTTGDVATYSYGLNGSSTTLSSLPNGQISHTFTVTMPGLAGSLLIGANQEVVNVPVPVSPDGIRPATVAFEVEFNDAGALEWRCTAPCDPYSMTTPGFMIGTISII